MTTFYSHLRIGLNCKNTIKAQRIQKKIEEAIKLDILNSKLVEHENNLFELTGHCLFDYKSKEEAVFNWLFHLDQLAYNWQIKAPSNYEDFFSFEGERWSYNQNFKIPGLTFLTFELTNRSLNYYNNAPLQEDQKVKILKSEQTMKEEINGRTGVILSIGTRIDKIWTFGVHIEELGQVYLLTENELTPVEGSYET